MTLLPRLLIALGIACAFPALAAAIAQDAKVAAPAQNPNVEIKRTERFKAAQDNAKNYTEVKVTVEKAQDDEKTKKDEPKKDEAKKAEAKPAAKTSREFMKA